jgi:hypothetical protein
MPSGSGMALISDYMRKVAENDKGTLKEMPPDTPMLMRTLFSFRPLSPRPYSASPAFLEECPEFFAISGLSCRNASRERRARLSVPCQSQRIHRPGPVAHGVSARPDEPDRSTLSGPARSSPMYPFLIFRCHSCPFRPATVYYSGHADKLINTTLWREEWAWPYWC